MTTILIPTILGDHHAAAVAFVLEQLGHRQIRWFCQDLPESATTSYRLSDRREDLTLNVLGPLDFGAIDVVWNRRVAPPILKRADVDPSDRAVASRETQRLIDGVLHAATASAFAVNPRHAAFVADNKLLQLHVARKVGFSLPETLISNSPAEIRAFIRERGEGGTIFKSFLPATWNAGDTSAVLFSHKVELEQLPVDYLLQEQPAIFQGYVPKAYEVRVTCMGGELFAVKLDSQATRKGGVDWRQAYNEQLSKTVVELPEEIAAKCREVMARLGLVFGCFDFIVTPGGDFVFLEVNEMGQFLWLEESLPELPLLQTFCEFLISQDPNFRRAGTVRPDFSFPSVIPAAKAIVANDWQVHSTPTTYAGVVYEGKARKDAAAQGVF